MSDLDTSDSGSTAAREQGRSERAQLAGRAGIVALGTGASRLLGLVREQVLAALFTRAATDVFFVAFLIPNVLRQLLAEGAVQTGVLPVLSEVQQKHGEQRAQNFFRKLRGLSLLVLAGVSVLGVLTAPWLVDMFAGGYRETPGQYERTVSLTRWLFPYIFFMGSAALGVAALNTHRRFLVTSFAPALLNVAFIAAAFSLTSWFTSSGIDPLHALTVGVLLGGALQLVAQWPSLRRIGYLESPLLQFRDPYLQKVLQRLGPVLFGFGIYYVDVVVARHLLSDLGVGAQSYFGFALRLCDFPQGIFVMAVQSATLPSLAALAARQNYQELILTFAHALRMAAFVAIPATLGCVLLAHPIVSLVFERGEFDAVASAETARALVAQGASIWAVACVRQLVIVFYALGDTRSPVLVAALDFLSFLTAALLLRESLGHVGIGWAVSLASVVQMLLLGGLLRRRLGSLDGRRTLASLAKTTLAAVLAGLLARAAAGAELPGPPTLMPGLVGVSVFGVAFLLLARLLRSPELHAITRRLRRSKET